MEIPKCQFKKTIRSLKGSLNNTGSGIAIFKNYRGDLDLIEVYKLTASDHNAFNECRFLFEYDYLLGKVQPIYKDSFKRIVNVEKLENEIPTF